MSVNTNQTAANQNSDFFIKTDGGSVMKYLGDIKLTTTSNISSEYQSTARILAGSGFLYFQNDNGINFTEPFQGGLIKAQINPDATQQNQIPGLYVSTSASIGGLLQTEGYYGTSMNIQQRDNNNNLVNNWQIFTSKNNAGGVQPSTLQMFNYAAKDNFQFNALTSPVFTINPNVPRIDIPTYSVNAASLLVSSINGALPPTSNSVIDIPQIIPANAAYAQQVTSAAIITDTAIIPGGVYQYDLGVRILSALANNAGAAPTYPYNILFGVRLGGNGPFDYANTVALQSAAGLGAGGISFNLTGMTTAGNAAQTIEIVIFQAQTGTTVSLSFGATNDPNMTLLRIQ